MQDDVHHHETLSATIGHNFFYDKSDRIGDLHNVAAALTAGIHEAAFAGVHIRKLVVFAKPAFDGKLPAASTYESHSSDFVDVLNDLSKGSLPDCEQGGRAIECRRQWSCWSNPTIEASAAATHDKPRLGNRGCAQRLDGHGAHSFAESNAPHHVTMLRQCQEDQRAKGNGHLLQGFGAQSVSGRIYIYCPGQRNLHFENRLRHVRGRRSRGLRSLGRRSVSLHQRVHRAMGFVRPNAQGVSICCTQWRQDPDDQCRRRISCQSDCIVVRRLAKRTR